MEDYDYAEYEAIEEDNYSFKFDDEDLDELIAEDTININM